MIKNPFVGSWALVSFEMRGSNGQVIYPMGQDALGYIVYTDDGHMSVAFMNNGRSNFNSEDLRGGSKDEKVFAFDTYFSYCGKYDLQGDKVVHHIEVSLFPNWIGKDQTRYFKFNDNQLILTSPPILFAGIEQTAYLIWKKCQILR